MVLHLAMPAHVLGFFALMVDPLDLIQEGRTLLNRSKTFIALLSLFSLVLFHGCLSHPFLLSDNR